MDRTLISEYRGKAPFVGIFTHRLPELLILEPSLVYEIFVGKFKHFHINYTNVMFKFASFLLSFSTNFVKDRVRNRFDSLPKY